MRYVIQPRRDDRIVLFHSEMEGRRHPLGKDELMHYRTKGSVNGVRRYQNKDGSLTPEGYRHYGVDPNYWDKAKAAIDQAREKSSPTPQVAKSAPVYVNGKYAGKRQVPSSAAELRGQQTPLSPTARSAQKAAHQKALDIGAAKRAEMYQKMAQQKSATQASQQTSSQGAASTQPAATSEQKSTNGNGYQWTFGPNKYPQATAPNQTSSPSTQASSQTKTSANNLQSLPREREMPQQGSSYNLQGLPRERTAPDDIQTETGKPASATGVTSAQETIEEQGAQTPASSGLGTSNLKRTGNPTLQPVNKTGSEGPVLLGPNDEVIDQMRPENSGSSGVSVQKGVGANSDQHLFNPDGTKKAQGTTTQVSARISDEEPHATPDQDLVNKNTEPNKNIFQQIGDFVGNAANDVGSWVNNNVINPVTGAVTDASQWLGGAWNGLTNPGAQIQVDPRTGKLDQDTVNGQAFGNDVRNFFGNGIEGAVNNAGQWLGGFWNGITNPSNNPVAMKEARNYTEWSPVGLPDGQGTYYTGQGSSFGVNEKNGMAAGNRIRNIVDGFGQGIGNAFNGAVNGVVDWGKGLLGLNGEPQQERQPGDVPPAEYLRVASANGTLPARQKPSYQGASSQENQNAGPNKNVFQQIGDWAGNAANGVGKWIGNAANDAYKWGSRAVNDAGNWIGNAANDAGQWLGSAYNSFNYGLNPGNTAAQRVHWYNIGNGQKDQDVINGANFGYQLGNGIRGAANGVGNFFGNVGQGVGNWIGNAANDAYKWGSRAVNDAGNWIGNAANEVGKWANNNVINPVTGAVTDASQWLNGAFTGLTNPNAPMPIDPATGKIDQDVLNGRSFGTKLGVGATNVWNTARDFVGNNVINPVTGAVNDVGNYVNGFATGLTDQSYNPVAMKSNGTGENSAMTNGANLGYNIRNAANAGLNFANDAWNGARNFATNAWNTARNTVGNAANVAGQHITGMFDSAVNIPAVNRLNAAANDGDIGAATIITLYNRCMRDPTSSITPELSQLFSQNGLSVPNEVKSR